MWRLSRSDFIIILSLTLARASPIKLKMMIKSAALKPQRFYDHFQLGIGPGKPNQAKNDDKLCGAGQQSWQAQSMKHHSRAVPAGFRLATNILAVWVFVILSCGMNLHETRELVDSL